MTEELDIIDITKKFGEAYARSKDWDAAKENGRKRFFQAATQELEKKRLPRKTVEVPKDQDVLEFIKIYHPGWRVLVDSVKVMNHVVIERDPALMKYSFINPEDNMVYGRTYSESGPMLDEEKLQQDDPDLWLAISEYDPASIAFTKAAMQEALSWTHAELTNSFLDKIIDDFLTDRLSRVVKNPSTWTTEQSTAVQKYMVPGPVSVRLVSPRPAKAEDREEVDS